MSDLAGNVGTDSVGYMLDRVPPVVRLEPIGERGFIRADDNSIRLQGSVADNEAIVVFGETVVPNLAGVFDLTVPLEFEGQVFRGAVTATDVAGNVGFASVELRRDLDGPELEIIDPADTATVIQAKIPVVVDAYDAGVGMASVQVNGVNLVETGGYWGGEVSLPEIGANELIFTAADRFGNTTVETIAVQRVPQRGLQFVVSGAGGRVGLVHSVLEEPLVVSVMNAAGTPMPHVPVGFQWVAGGGGIVSSVDETVMSGDVLLTDAAGKVSARVFLGNVAGKSQRLRVEAVGAQAPQTVVFEALAEEASEVVMVSGNDQVAFVGETLPTPLVVKTVDIHGNAVGGAEVEAIVASGGGTLGDGSRVVATSNSDGLLEIAWRVGMEPARDQLLVVRLVEGDGAAVAFRAHGVRSGPVGKTVLSGQVLTPTYVPVSGVSVSCGAVVGVTEGDGSFSLEGVPAGPQLLRIDASSLVVGDESYRVGALVRPVQVLAGAHNEISEMLVLAAAPLADFVRVGEGEAVFGGGPSEVQISVSEGALVDGLQRPVVRSMAMVPLNPTQVSVPFPDDVTPLFAGSFVFPDQEGAKLITSPLSVRLASLDSGLAWGEMGPFHGDPLPPPEDVLEFRPSALVIAPNDFGGVMGDLFAVLNLNPYTGAWEQTGSARVDGVSQKIVGSGVRFPTAWGLVRDSYPGEKTLVTSELLAASLMMRSDKDDDDEDDDKEPGPVLIRVVHGTSAAANGGDSKSYKYLPLVVASPIIEIDETQTEVVGDDFLHLVGRVQSGLDLVEEAGGSAGGASKVLVVVRGEEIAVADDGSFTTDVFLYEPDQVIGVTAYNVLDGVATDHVRVIGDFVDHADEYAPAPVHHRFELRLKGSVPNPLAVNEVVLRVKSSAGEVGSQIVVPVAAGAAEGVLLTAPVLVSARGPLANMGDLAHTERTLLVGDLADNVEVLVGNVVVGSVELQGVEVVDAEERPLG
ncbi:MAG: hypothetical protein PF961_00310, partial [Planctomycetota bacterium]|nr:hypothetical protein [Planctomycetota bacterium]